MNEINSEFGSLFSEKKYKELLVFAKAQEKDQLYVLANQLQPLLVLVKELSHESIHRVNLLNKGSEAKMHEEESKTASTIDDLSAIFNVLQSDELYTSYISELF